MKDDAVNWLKEQCSRLTYGQCTTHRCLKRGGWKGGPFSPDELPYLATCEPYEIAQELSYSLDERQYEDLVTPQQR